MGNSQSTGQPNRLSKPRTNTNSLGPAIQADSPVSVSSRYADLSTKDRQQIRDTLLSPAGTEFGSVLGSHKDDIVNEPAAQMRGRPLSVISRSNSRTHSRTNSRSNSLSCFGSRQGSMSKLGFADSKISLASNTQVDLETAIKLLQEVKKNASPEDLAALHEALDLEGHAVAVTEHGLAQKNSVGSRSSSSLTRRRSLIQTPGLATRNSPVEGRRKTWNSWKAPKLEPGEEAKWNAHSKSTPPSNRVAALALPGKTSESSSPRAATPGEMDYSHLGGLRLGSLVVMNGAPSPAPSAVGSKQKSRQVAEDDYFSAVDHSSSPLMMKTERKRGHAKSKSSVLPMSAPIYQNPVVPNNERSRMVPQPVQSHSNSEDRSARAQSEMPIPERLQSIERSADANAHNASRYAQSYQAEIPMSPFGPSEETYSDIRNRSFASNNNQSFKEEAARVLDGTIFELDTAADEKALPMLSSSTSPKKNAQPTQRPPPQTADSGYSSGGSVRQANYKQQSGPLPKAPTHRSRSPLKSDITSEDLTTIAQTSAESAQAQKCPVHHAPALPKSPTSKTQTQRRPTSLKIPDPSARSSARSSATEATLSPQTPRSVASNTSLDSSSSTLQKRMHRRRPSQPELLVVQSCQPIPEGTIPQVPEILRAKFSRRLSSTPGIECLTHTYPTKHHVLADETTAYVPPTQAPKVVQLTELEPERPPTPPVHGRRRSLSLFRRKSTFESKEAEKQSGNASLDVIDLGTIASSLGTSPYDIAMIGPPRKPVTYPTHPHQLGNSLPRAKSMVNMDSEAAAEFARLRSKDLTFVEPEMPQQRRDIPPQRRKSHHNLISDIGEAKASKRRPQSYVQDAPPVPFLDHSKISAAHGRPRPESEQLVIKPEACLRAYSRERSQVVSSQLANQQHNIDWEAHSQAWSKRRKSIGEGLRTKKEFTEASASTVNAGTKSETPENMAAWGRFSGGLDYAYEGRGVGIGGSAGTRQLNSYASTKSLHWRNQYGVDLSDVPVLLQRV